MIGKRLLTLVLHLFPVIIYSQSVQLQWANTVSGNSGDYSLAVGSDAAGNVYSVGTFTGTVDMDPGTGVFNMTAQGLHDMFIVKYDANGNFVWAKQIGNDYVYNEEPRNMTVDPAGNVYITGNFFGTLDFDPGPGVANLTCAGTGYAAFLLKLDQDGNFMWAKNIAQSDYGNTGHAVAVAASGNIYVTGIFQGVTDFDPGPANSNVSSSNSSQDIFISKFDDSGNFIWSKQFTGTEGQVAYSIKVDASENIYTTGVFYGTTDFDPGPGTYNLMPNSSMLGSWPDAFVTKLDANGNFIWARQFDGVGNQIGFGLALDPSGNIIITGEFQGDTDFDPGPGVFTLSLSGSIIKGFIVKLDNNGQFIWAKELGEGGVIVQPYSVACDAAGNIYTTGSFSGNPDFDPGNGVYKLSGSTTFANVFISKLYADGSFGFAKQIVADGFSHAYNVATDAGENIYVSGYFSGEADFDPEAGEYIKNSKGGLDGFVIKLSQCAQPTSETVIVSTCNSYKLNSQVYTSSGTYVQKLTNVAGCDSTLTLKLTIGGFTTNIDTIVCDNYIWQGQTYTSSGSYSVTLKSLDGCDSILNLNLIVNKSISSVINTTICSGESYGGHDESGTYVDTFMAANGCDSVRTLHLTVKPISQQVFNARICGGDNYWGHTATGTYRDTIIAVNGCDSIRILNLQVDPVRHEYINIDLCRGETYYAGGGYQSSAGIYRDTLSTYSGCDSIIFTTINVFELPVPDLGDDRNICTGTTISLIPGSFANYEWQDGTSGSSLTVYNPGVYWVKVKNSQGCLNVDSIIIANTVRSPENFLKPVDSICQYDKLQLSPANNYSAYTWSTGSNEASVIVDAPGRYILEVRDKNGCYGRDTTDVYAKICKTGVFIPNAFTPNGDGKNDVFRAIIFGKVVSFKMDIYNRWGELIFSTTNPQKGWDGKTKAFDNNTSVFIWQCSYKLEGEEMTRKRGTVTLLR